MRWPIHRRDQDHVGEDVTVIDYFDDFEGPNEHAFLSNVYASRVQIGNFEFPTVEHYFQGMKPTSDKQRDAIRLASSPGKAKAMGRRCKLRPDWELVKVDVMLRGVRSKFGQHPDLADKLIATGDAMLVEGNTWGDRVWGCVDGEGENLLGLILMLVRAELRLARG